MSENPLARGGAEPRCSVPAGGRHCHRGVRLAKVRSRMMALKLEKAEETGRGEGRLPLAHVPRDPHADERHHRAVERGVAVGRGHARPSARVLERINTSAQFLLSLVNDILDMSKIRERQGAHRGGAAAPGVRWPRACESMFWHPGARRRAVLPREAACDDRGRGGGRRRAAAAGAGEPACPTRFKFTDRGRTPSRLRVEACAAWRGRGRARRARFCV